MRKEWCFYSSLNGALTEPQIFFRMTVEVKESSALPKIGSIVPPACIAKEWDFYGLKPGVVTDAKNMDNGTQRVCVAVPTPHQPFRDCLGDERDDNHLFKYEKVLGSPR